ncbi:MAG: acetyltransferase, partial [Pseudomonadota bacterium]
MNILRGSAALLFIITNTILACVPLYAMGLARLILPRSQHARWTRAMDGIIDYWTGCNRALLRTLGISAPQLTLGEGTTLSREHWYLIICNHQSWSDILLLQTQLRPLIPPIKFFTKRQLIYLPFLGVAMWLLGFPYVRRVSRQQAAANPKLKDADRHEIERACEGFRLHPTSVLNFTEGTRFSPEKHAAQDARFTHLLNPRVGGVAMVVAGLGEQLDGLLDIT